MVEAVTAPDALKLEPVWSPVLPQQTNHGTA